MTAKYSLGKIHSKNVILDIIGFSHSREEAGHLLMGTSRKFRELIKKENFKAFINCTKKEILVELEIIVFRTIFYKRWLGFNLLVPDYVFLNRLRIRV